MQTPKAQSCAPITGDHEHKRHAKDEDPMWREELRWVILQDVFHRPGKETGTVRLPSGHFECSDSKKKEVPLIDCRKCSKRDKCRTLCKAAKKYVYQDTPRHVPGERLMPNYVMDTAIIDAVISDIGGGAPLEGIKRSDIDKLDLARLQKDVLWWRVIKRETNKKTARALSIPCDKVKNTFKQAKKVLRRQYGRDTAIGRAARANDNNHFRVFRYAINSKSRFSAIRLSPRFFCFAKPGRNNSIRCDSRWTPRSAYSGFRKSLRSVDRVWGTGYVADFNEWAEGLQHTEESRSIQSQRFWLNGSVIVGDKAKINPLTGNLVCDDFPQKGKKLQKKLKNIVFMVG